MKISVRIPLVVALCLGAGLAGAWLGAPTPSALAAPTATLAAAPGAVTLALQLDFIKDELPLSSFQWSEAMPLSAGPSGASRMHGRVTMTDLVVTRELDANSPVLALKVAGGENVKTAKLTIRAGGAEYYLIELEDVIITSYSVAGGTGSEPTETLTLNFNKIKWTGAAPPASSGPPGTKGRTSAGWSLDTNKKL